MFPDAGSRRRTTNKGFNEMYSLVLEHPGGLMSSSVCEGHWAIKQIPLISFLLRILPCIVKYDFLSFAWGGGVSKLFVCSPLSSLRMQLDRVPWETLQSARFLPVQTTNLIYYKKKNLSSSRSRSSSAWRSMFSAWRQEIVSLCAVEKWRCVFLIPIGWHWSIQRALGYKIASWEGISGDGEVEREGRLGGESDEEVCLSNWFDCLAIGEARRGAPLGDYVDWCHDNRIQKGHRPTLTRKRQKLVCVAVKNKHNGCH